ncbi:MAG: hypothetical protein U1F43_01780 [Myxococcota bacterium]
MKKAAVQTTARVRVSDKELGQAFRQANLGREEELVLRMRYGIAEPRSAALEYRGQHIPEIAAKLAMMEAATLDEMRATTPPVDPRESAMKARIIDRLKRL